MLLAESCTTKIIDKDHERVGRWLEQQRACRHTSASVCIGLERRGELVAGIQYDNYNGASMVASIAVTGRLTPEFLHYIFEYPYLECGIQVGLLYVSSANVKSQRFVEKLGFVRIASIEDADPHGQLLLYQLRKEDCRFLTRRSRHGW